MVHCDWPTHAAATLAALCAASHAPFLKPPRHEPVGVPKDAKSTPVNLPPLQYRLRLAFSGAVPHGPLAPPGE